MPLIVSDIDGVLLNGKVPIKYVNDGLQLIEESAIPLYVLTNRSMMTAKIQSEAFENAYGKRYIEDHQIVFSSSPLVKIFKQYENKLVLLITRWDFPREIFYFESEMAKHPYLKYLTGQEFCLLYPELVDLYLKFQPFYEQRDEMLKSVEQRLGLSVQEIRKDYIQIDAIFIMSNPTKWEMYLQILLDVLSTENGKIAQTLHKENPEKHIPVYSMFNDLTFNWVQASQPRQLVGTFNSALQVLYKQLYQCDMQPIICTGKPNVEIFRYIEELAQHDKRDNPESDIQGANNAGWKSFLVQTGMHKSAQNDKEFPATYVCKDFFEAVQTIMQIEGIK